jgi:peptidyl-prolyl cis-trans isomerase SurA
MKKHVIGAVLAGVLSFVAAPGAEILEQVLVRVNGEIFTKTDLEARQVMALRQTGQDIDLKSAAADAQLRKMLDDITPELMVNVIDEMLIVQRGRELGYRMTDEQYNTTVERLKKDNNITTDEQFQAALKQEGMTTADLRRNLERQMIVQYVRQNQILARIAVADEEAREYYKAHVSEFTTQPAISLREVFVAIPGEGTPTAAAEQTAREKAESIRAKAIAGESFEKLAADLSDAPSRANGGLIGPFALDELSADLRKRVAGMKQGDVTEVIPAGRGFQVLKVETLQPAQTRSFEEAREDIANRIFSDKQRIEFEKYLDTLRNEAIIDWKSQEVRKAYEAGLAALKAKAPAPPPPAD